MVQKSYNSIGSCSRRRGYKFVYLERRISSAFLLYSIQRTRESVMLGSSMILIQKFAAATVLHSSSDISQSEILEFYALSSPVVHNQGEYSPFY